MTSFLDFDEGLSYMFCKYLSALAPLLFGAERSEKPA